MELSTQFKGTITELQVATYFLQLGYVVSQPLTQNSKYDLLVDVNGKIIRVQVKTARKNLKNLSNTIVFNCRSTTQNVRECKKRYYSEEEIDFFATYWDGKVYLVKVSECSAEKTLWLDKPVNKNCCCANNYLAEVILNDL